MDCSSEVSKEARNEIMSGSRLIKLLGLLMDYLTGYSKVLVSAKSSEHVLEQRSEHLKDFS